MAASAKKKNRKGTTICLTDFLAEDGGTGGESTYVPEPVSWADETDDLEGDVSTTWHSCSGTQYQPHPYPKSPPYTAFLGNLPYEVTEESIKEFIRELNTSGVNPERLKGFGYAEFEDLDSLLSALSLKEESLSNRRIQVNIADQAQDKDRDDQSCCSNPQPSPYPIKTETGIDFCSASEYT
uniref:RRM domain-containing protein n=1 Tax=Microcebus murinus TaxID=30608 RepID=A0A8C5Y045_MICMU